MKLNKKELTMISGGAIKLGAGLIIVSAIIFVIGVIDGYVRP
ncbi:MAG TPA: class IIb bacteriocin, lactobin A/cerein 7B family, partial [Tenericutes bacterium]|nr:class IIb bacteriocin, lactobin A/cerein 7B family [Mycoplasmatota bacterium]